MEKNRQGLALKLSVKTSQGNRVNMDDNYCIIYHCHDGSDEKESVFLGVFDGHGGGFASAFVKEHLENEITKMPGFSSDDDDAVLESIKKGFLSCQELLKAELIKLGKLSKDGRFTEASHAKVGTTATVAFVRNSKLFIGHAGDSRMVLGYKDAGCSDDIWKAKQLTKDHKPDDPEELARILSVGGKISTKMEPRGARIVWSYPAGYSESNEPLAKRPRFDGQPFDMRSLNIARSLGNFWSFNEKTEEYVVSPLPDVSVYQLDENKDKCLILGSDGLWDVVTPEEAVEEMRLTKNHNLQQDRKQPGSKHIRRIKAAKKLVKIALKKYSDEGRVADNITVIAVYFNPLKEKRLDS